MKFKTIVLLTAAVMALAACGGGGGGETPPVQADPLDALPPEATQSVSAWIGFLDRLAKAPGAEVREGFGVSSTGVTSVPGDDLAEPTLLQSREQRCEQGAAALTAAPLPCRRGRITTPVGAARAALFYNARIATHKGTGKAPWL